MKRTLLLLAILLLLVPGMMAFGQAKTTIKFVNYLYSPSDDPSWIGNWMAEKFPDVEFKPIGIMATTYYDQLNVMIAGGDVPDVIWQINAAGTVVLVDQGVMMEVPYSLIKENMPKSWGVRSRANTMLLVKLTSWIPSCVSKTQPDPKNILISSSELTEGASTDWKAFFILFAIMDDRTPELPRFMGSMRLPPAHPAE